MKPIAQLVAVACGVYIGVFAARMLAPIELPVVESPLVKYVNFFVSDGEVHEAPAYFIIWDNVFYD